MGRSINNIREMTVTIKDLTEAGFTPEEIAVFLKRDNRDRQICKKERRGLDEDCFDIR